MTSASTRRRSTPPRMNSSAISRRGSATSPSHRLRRRSPAPRLALLDRERERAPAVDDAAVELLHVLLRVVLFERARIRIAELGEPVGRRLDRELVIAVQLLGLVAV